MALRKHSEVDLSGMSDPQRPVAFGVGLLLVVVAVAGLTGIIDTNIGFGDGLVFGVFGVPFWLGVTALVAGVLGIALSFYAGAGTTFNKLAAGLVLPIVILLAIGDWALRFGGVFLALTLVTFLLAGLGVVIGVVLLNKRPVGLVLPVVAVLTLADWVLGLTAMVPTSEHVNLPTLGLLVVLTIAIGVIAFEGGARMT